MNRLFIVAALAICLDSVDAQAASTCFGSTAKGRLENGERLPPSGSNFFAYSTAGVMAGRTHVHSRVRALVVRAYAELERSLPDSVFVYGETGWAAGGSFRPHRTHQNGLSVDFMVPVLDAAGKSVPLPTNAFNKYGYAIDFDHAGRWQGLRIDFEAIAEHLFSLKAAAKADGADLALVILDVDYLPMLFATKRGSWLRDNVRFMQQQAWVRHDDHYHIDFAIACKPLPK